MSFRITGLSPEPFQHLYGLSDQELARHGVKRYIADKCPGFPDRIEMRDALVREKLLVSDILSRCLAILVILWLARPQAVFAQTDEIQVYDAQIAAPGVFNLTWHDNYTPDGRTSPDYPGGIVPDHTLNGVPEWAYGVAPWLEAGLYLPLYSLAGTGAVTFNGFKLRTLFVEPDAANQRFIYGVNFEFSYNTAHWNQNRYTQEGRPIIGWHLGPLDVIVNPILDNSYKGFAELDFAPATRVAYNFNKTWGVAAEDY